MSDAPHRITVDWDEKPRSSKIGTAWESDTGDFEYILATPAALSEHPAVKALLAEAEARGMERAAKICAGLADQVSDAVLTGLPEQARFRESMEAAFTKARHAISAEAALKGDDHE